MSAGPERAEERRRTLASSLLAERLAKETTATSPSVVATNEIQGTIRGLLREVGRSGDLDEILGTERALLTHSRRYYANSPAMVSSLDNALADLTITEELVRKVHVSRLYQAVDEGHRRPQNRVGGVPKDEARQFFSSHQVRLQNLDKGEVNESEKRTLALRRTNLAAARRLYVQLQRQALGIDRPRGRETPGLER